MRYYKTDDAQEELLRKQRSVKLQPNQQASQIGNRRTDLQLSAIRTSPQSWRLRQTYCRCDNEDHP